MKRVVGTFCILSAVISHGAGASFLKNASFPTTFEDLSFTTRMEVERAGYEDWEPEYDASGHCIRGCAYRGMKIEDDLAMMERQTNSALNALQAAGIALPTAGGNVNVPTAATPAQPVQYVPAPTTPNVSAPSAATAPPRCTPNNPAIAVNQKYPIGEPVTGTPRISSPFGDRIHPVTGIRTPHRGVDLAVPTGTNVFSPADGTVASVWTDDTCGRGVRITHTGGFETTYCHLSQQLVKSGDAVAAGCRIGQSGNTGRSTGPHLHYGIKQNGTYINPNKFMGRG